MFFFGFLGIFIITQMYGLGLKPWVRWSFIGSYIAAVALVYSQRGWSYLNEIVRIPAIDYLVVIVIALLIWAGIRLSAWLALAIRRPIQNR